MGNGKLLEWRDDSPPLKGKWVRAFSTWVGAFPLDKWPDLSDLPPRKWVGDDPVDDDDDDTPDLSDLPPRKWVGYDPVDDDDDTPDLSDLPPRKWAVDDDDMPDSTPFALMFNGPFEKATEAANDQDRWLLVNLQSTKEFSSHQLNRDTWGIETVAQIINSNFIFCQIYDDTQEGSKISTYYTLDSVPVTIVIDPITGQKMRLWHGMIHPEELLVDLSQFMDVSPKEHHASSSSKGQRAISRASPPKIQEETIEDDEDMKLARALSMGTMEDNGEQGADSEPSCNTDSHNDTNTKSNITIGIGVSEDELVGQLLSAFADMKQFGCEEIDCEQLAEIFKQQAMLLDPTNESVRENVQAAERKVWQQREESGQDMEKSGYKEIDLKNLADMFKLQGNKAMQSKLYAEAIELYTAAIALCGDNAIYYCNRAAAYTQTCQYAEAILDCQKSLVIDPKYIKAYSRLGYIYFAQGKYTEALEKGYRIAVRLDSTNESVRENVRAAERKVWQQREESGQVNR